MAYAKIFDGNGLMLEDIYFSGGGSSGLDMIEKDPNYGKIYMIRGAFTNKENAKGIEKMEKHKINVVRRDHQKIYAELEKNLPEMYVKDPASKSEYQRQKYDMIVLDAMSKLEGSPDVICLSGYMRILSTYFLEEIKKKKISAINVHPAKLAWLTNGRKTIDASNLTKDEIEKELGLSYRRLLTGDKAVVDAIKKGFTELNSTIHLVTEKLDGGPILVTSPTVIINQEDAKKIGLELYAESVQNLMKDACDSPAYFKALELIAKGLISVDYESEAVLIEDKVAPYGGFLMEGRYRAVAETSPGKPKIHLEPA